MTGQSVEKILDVARGAIELDDEARVAYFTDHPELLAVQHHGAVLDATQGSTESEAVAMLLAERAQFVEACRGGHSQYGIGLGPFEALWSRVLNGLMGQTQAERAAADLGLAAEADLYLEAICSVSRQYQPADAVSLLSIVRAGLARRPSGALGTASGIDLELRYVSVVTRHLRDVADGRLFRQTRAVAETVLAHIRDDASAPDADEGACLAVLADLWSHPYSGARRSVTLDQELWEWRRRFAIQHQHELAGTDPESWAMPDATEALLTGADLYVQAAEHSTGHERGLALKGAVQGRLFAESIGAPLDRAIVVQLAREAADLIDPELAPSETVAVLGNLHFLGENVDPAPIERLLNPSFDFYLQRFGPQMVLDLAVNLPQVLTRGVAVQRAEEVTRRARPLVELIDREYATTAQWRNEIDVAVGSRVPGGWDALPDSSLVEAKRAVDERAAAEDWEPLALAAAYLGLAGRTERRDEEAGGLELLDEVEVLAPIWSREHANALHFLRSGLRLGIGVNAFTAEHWSEALRWYSAALGDACQLMLTDTAVQILGRIEDLAGRAGGDAAIHLISGVAAFAVQLENLSGPSATASTQRILRRGLALLFTTPYAVNPEALVLALQSVKGLRYSALLLSRDRFRWTEDRSGEELLSAIAEAETILSESRANVDEIDRPLDDNLMLATFSDVTGSRSDYPEVDRLAVLRQEYDRRLIGRLLKGSRNEDVVWILSDGLQRALDDRTVLIDIFLGATPDGNAGLFTLSLTATTQNAALVDLDFPDAQVQFGDEAVRGSILAGYVADLRRDLMVPSEPDDVSSDVRERLDGLLSHIMEGVSAHLDEWREQGRDHLCFVPHDALHYLPFHLLQHSGEPLASTWTVTTLPNHALLLDNRGGATIGMRRHRQLAAFGLTYPPGNPHGLPALCHAGDEASRVAAVFDDLPILDDEATELAFVDALGASRYVHLAAHGRHDYNAPAFQCVYLTPSGDADGLLRAHELLALDLRGTEMVTLSACETSLGRVDNADNPRGLVPSLLLAGVQSVVGTLWDVRSDTASTFFTTLYEELRSGVERREAFSRAQRRTRSEFPVYRDWGAFTFVGS